MALQPGDHFSLILYPPWSNSTVEKEGPKQQQLPQLARVSPMFHVLLLYTVTLGCCHDHNTPANGLKLRSFYSHKRVNKFPLQPVTTHSSGHLRSRTVRRLHVSPRTLVIIPVYKLYPFRPSLASSPQLTECIS